MMIRFDNTACISSSIREKQFCAVCFLGEAWENNMKMISFLYNKYIWCLQANTKIKAKLKSLGFFFFYVVSCPFYCSGICICPHVSLCDRKYEEMQASFELGLGRYKIDMRNRADRTHTHTHSCADLEISSVSVVTEEGPSRRVGIRWTKLECKEKANRHQVDANRWQQLSLSDRHLPHLLYLISASCNYILLEDKHANPSLSLSTACFC